MQIPLLAAGAVVLALTTGGCAGPSAFGPAAGGTGHPAPVPAATGLSTPGDAPASLTTVRSELAGLRLAAPHAMTGYSRAAFGLWARQSDACDTEEEALRRTGRRIVAGATDCSARAGSWYSAYDGTTLTSASRATVDHVVPLAEAWRSGADTWTARQRAALGNDLTDPQLAVVSRAAHTAKGDKGPARWKPSNRAVWCAYAEDYTHVKAHFQLTTTPAEKTALTRMLATCR